MNFNYNSQYSPVNFLQALKECDAPSKKETNQDYFQAFRGLEAPFQKSISMISNNGGVTFYDLSQATPESVLERETLLAEQRKKILAASDTPDVQYLSCEFGDSLYSNELESMRQEVKKQVNTVVERAKKVFNE